jgi:hypothetical protein
MLSQEELKALSEVLPKDWVSKVQLIVNFKGTKIREVLREPEHYDKEVMDAILEVASEEKEKKNRALAEQRKRLNELVK